MSGRDPEKARARDRRALLEQIFRGHLYRRALPHLAIALDRLLAAYRRATR